MMTDEAKVNLTNEKPVKIIKDNENGNDGVESEKIEIKIYKRRWIMLGLYVFYAALVAGQWIQYSIISNIVAKYYSISAGAVDWTSMIYMLFYTIFIFPITFLEQKFGLRWTVVLGSALCCTGSWIKTFSVNPDGFYMTLFGQSVVALSLVFMLPLPGRVGANWFGSDQLSTATCLGVFGPQLGVSLSFLLGPIIVKDHDNLDDIGADLLFMFKCVAGISSVNLLLCTLFFQEEPKLPPTETRALQKSNRVVNKEGFIESMKRLFTNKSFLILCNSHGLNVGILNVIGTMLNQLFLIHFEHGEEDAGRIGLLIILTGMFGSVTFGIILDKTRKFKETTVIVYFLTLCGQILFTVAMLIEIKWIVYAAAIFLGFFMSGYLALGYEMAVEYTYPESEAHSAGILNITNNVYGIILVLILQKILASYGDVPVHIIFCGILFIGTVMTAMTKDEQRRQDARKAVTYKDVPQKEDDKNLKKNTDIEV